MPRLRGIPLYMQLRDHIRTIIQDGQLKPGQKLAGVRQMSEYLGINRHTVSRAFHELETMGLVVMRRGRGTFVTEESRTEPRRDRGRLMEIAWHATEQSRTIGFSREELSSAILAGDRYEPDSELDDFCIGFVECNPISLERYAEDLRAELGTQVKPLLIPDLRDQLGLGLDPLEGCDLVVTTLGHLPEVRRILGNSQEIHSVNVGPYLQVFLEVIALPQATRVGIVTASELGSRQMRQALVQAGVDAERLLLASLEQRDRIGPVVRDADALVVSFAAMEVAQGHLRDAETAIIEYQNVLDVAGVEALRELLVDIRLRRPSATRAERGVNRLDVRRVLSEFATANASQ